MECGMKGHALACVMMLASVSAWASDAPRLPAPEESAKDRLNASPRHGEFAKVDVGGTPVRTWIVYPERKDRAPVVVVIHEIFGLTDWIRAVADQLAAEGFIAVAPDLLSGKGSNGGGTDSFSADEVRGAIQKLTPEEVARRLDAVREYALAFPSAKDKTATIGFCWGGGQSFAYATHQPKLNAAVVYYGTPPKDSSALGKIRCPVLGLYGQADNRVTSTVEPTAKSMSELGKSYTHHEYENAGHGFLRQQSGRDGANLKASRQAWGQTREIGNLST